MTDYIYTLSDPRNNKVRYVGKTDNPKRRLAAHIIDKDVCHRTNWIKQLTKNNLEPIMTIIEKVAKNQSWEDRERYWISHYRSIGCNLTNMTDGGDCGPDCTGKNLVKSEQGRNNIIKALVKRNKSQKMREISRRNGKRRKGKKLPTETVEKIRQKAIGRKMHSDEFKEALAKRNKERIYDEEAKDAMRERSRKLWDDPIKGAEMREKLIERNKSKELKKKIADSRKAKKNNHKIPDL